MNQNTDSSSSIATIDPSTATHGTTTLDKEARVQALLQEQATLVAEIEAEKRAAREATLTQIKALMGQLGGEPKDLLAELGLSAPKGNHLPQTLPRHGAPRRTQTHLHSTSPVVAMNPRTMNRRHSKGFRLNEGQYLAVQAALKLPNVTIKGIARRFGVSRQTVYGVRDGAQRAFPKAA